MWLDKLYRMLQAKRAASKIRAAGAVVTKVAWEGEPTVYCTVSDLGVLFSCYGVSRQSEVRFEGGHKQVFYGRFDADVRLVWRIAGPNMIGG